MMNKIINGIITTAKVIVSLAMIGFALVYGSAFIDFVAEHIKERRADAKASAKFDEIMTRQNEALKNR